MNESDAYVTGKIKEILSAVGVTPDVKVARLKVEATRWERRGKDDVAARFYDAAQRFSSSQESNKSNPPLMNEEEVEALAKKGRAYVADSNYFEARKIFNYILNMQQRHNLPIGMALRSLAIIDFADGKANEGCEKFDELVRLYPYDAELLRERAERKLNIKNKMEVLAEFDEVVISRFSTAPEFWIARGHLYDCVENFSESVRSYQRALELFPDNLEARNSLVSVGKKFVDQQRNKKSSPPSIPSPLSSSPDKHSSASPNSSPNRSSSNSNSSGEFRVSPELPAKMTVEERRLKEESLEAEIARLDKEIQALRVQSSSAEEKVQRINRALKDAKIPEIIELDTLKQHKQKESKKVAYLNKKVILKELLDGRQEARKVVAECAQRLTQTEQDKRAQEENRDNLRSELAQRQGMQVPQRAFDTNGQRAAANPAPAPVSSAGSSSSFWAAEQRKAAAIAYDVPLYMVEEHAGKSLEQLEAEHKALLQDLEDLDKKFYQDMKAILPRAVEEGRRNFHARMEVKAQKLANRK